MDEDEEEKGQDCGGKRRIPDRRIRDRFVEEDRRMNAFTSTMADVEMKEVGTVTDRMSDVGNDGRGQCAE